MVFTLARSCCGQLTHKWCLSNGKSGLLRPDGQCGTDARGLNRIARADGRACSSLRGARGEERGARPGRARRTERAEQEEAASTGGGRGGSQRFDKPATR